MIAAASLISGCAGSLVGVGAGAKIIHPTKADTAVISDTLVTQIVSHNRWCEKAPECKKD